MLIYTHCWELMNSVGSHGSLSLPFVMKVIVCHFVSDFHEVMTALVVMLPLIVGVDISLQLHQSNEVDEIILRRILLYIINNEKTYDRKIMSNLSKSSFMEHFKLI